VKRVKRTRDCSCPFRFLRLVYRCAEFSRQSNRSGHTFRAFGADSSLRSRVRLVANGDRTSGPATTTIIARIFGLDRVGRIFGLVFVFHQLGGASAAIGGGWTRVYFGDYQYAFVVGGCMGLLAAFLALTIQSAEQAAPGSFKKQNLPEREVSGNGSRSTTSYWLQPAICDGAGRLWRDEEFDKRVSRIRIPATYGDTGGEHRDFLHVGRQRRDMV
jgi:hypothetical protein